MVKVELEGRLLEDTTTLADIIQIAARGAGVVELSLTLDNGDPIGTIWMTDGRILDAETPSCMGLNAFFEIFDKGMTTPGSCFKLLRRRGVHPEGHDLGQVHTLLMDAAFHMDSVRAGLIPEGFKTLNLGPVESGTCEFNETLTMAMKAYGQRDFIAAMPLFERLEAMRPKDRGIQHNLRIIRSKVEGLAQRGA